MKMYLERKIKKDIEKGIKLRIFENPNNLNPLDLDRINEKQIDIHNIFWSKSQKSINLNFFFNLNQLNVEVLHEKGYYLINLYNFNCNSFLNQLKENKQYFDFELVFINQTLLKDLLD